MSDREWGHDELQADLARSRIGTGEVVVEKLSVGIWGGAGELDVWAQKLSRTKPRPTCYEVKVTRADFLADVRAEKHRKYEPWAERCYFATPSGLVLKKEIPEGWGLTVRGENGWHSVKRAARREIEPEMWKRLHLAVVLALHPGPWQEPDRLSRITSLADNATEEEARLRWAGLQGKFGRRIQGILNGAEEARQSAEESRAAVQAAAEALGVEVHPHASAWAIRRELRERVREIVAQGAA